MKVSISNLLNKRINLYFKGGSYFENAEGFKDVEAISWYLLPAKKLLPAILYIKVGKGNVISSGVHFEYAPDLFDKIIFI